MKGKLAYTIVRVIFGLAWIFYGAVKFFPMPAPELPAAAVAFLGALGATGYMIPFLGIAELAIGLMLVFNRWVPLSMMILSPIMLNIVLFNLFLSLSLSSAIMLLILVLMQVYIMYCTWDAYKPLFGRQRK
ncbi:MAG: DoxX protein [Nanoarchaeota archaeon]